MGESTPFWKPRLVGERFQDHAIPLEVLKDLAVLEEFVVEVAKWCFLSEHQDRRRVPKGFTGEITLKLTRIGDGSAVAEITQSVEGGDLLPPGSQHYFEIARDRIIRAVAAAENDERVTKHLPESLLGYFDRLGRGLREGEAIEFAPDRVDRRARLDKVTRRRLVLASSKVKEVTEEVRLRGTVPGVDKDKLMFTLALADGGRVSAPLDAQHRETILEAFLHFEDGTRVMLRGVGRFDRNERLQRIESVEHINLLDPRDIDVRLDEFRLLDDGWLDGRGVAPSEEGLDWLSGWFSTDYPDDLPLPYLYPTAEGGVQAEWSLGRYEVTLEVNLDRHTAEWHYVNLDTDDDKLLVFDLDSSGLLVIIADLKTFLGESV